MTEEQQRWKEQILKQRGIMAAFNKARRQLPYKDLPKMISVGPTRRHKVCALSVIAETKGFHISPTKCKAGMVWCFQPGPGGKVRFTEHPIGKCPFSKYWNPGDGGILT